MVISDGEIYFNTWSDKCTWGCHECKKEYPTPEEARKCYKSHIAWELEDWTIMVIFLIMVIFFIIIMVVR